MNSTLVTRIGVAILALTGLAVGGYATAAPRHFYDEFPFGRTWIAADGPFNEHLLRDFGTLNLALGIVALCAVFWLKRPLVVATALGWLVYSVPHLGYHVFNLEHYDSTDQVGLVVTLLATPIVALAVLLLSLRERNRAEAGA